MKKTFAIGDFVKHPRSRMTGQVIDITPNPLIAGDFFAEMVAPDGHTWSTYMDHLVTWDPTAD